MVLGPCAVLSCCARPVDGGWIRAVSCGSRVLAHEIGGRGQNPPALAAFRSAGYARPVTPSQEQRLQQAARDAHAAEACGDDAAANEAWRRYRLIKDASRDPDELLAEGSR
jgi:hypothetical protein